MNEWRHYSNLRVITWLDRLRLLWKPMRVITSDDGKVYCKSDDGTIFVYGMGINSEATEDAERLAQLYIKINGDSKS